MIREGLPEKVFEQRLKGEKGKNISSWRSGKCKGWKVEASRLCKEKRKLVWLVEERTREGWRSDKG